MSRRGKVPDPLAGSFKPASATAAKTNRKIAELAQCEDPVPPPLPRGGGLLGESVRGLIRASHEATRTTPRSTLTVTIEGGEAFHRERLTSEIIALLDSLHITVDIDRSVVEVDDDEHHDHLQRMAHDVTVQIRRKP